MEYAKKTTATTYTQDDTNQAFKLNPRAIEINITDDAGNHRRTTTAYNTFNLPSNVNCSLPSDVYEYAADASTIIRKTHIDYNLGPAYLSTRVLGLPATVSVSDGNGILASQIGYQYDAGVQNQGAAVQHDETNFGSGFVLGRGNLTSVQHFNAFNTSQFLQSSIAYNTVGDVVSQTDPAGRQTLTGYSDSFSGGTAPGLTLAYPSSITNPDGFASLTQYNYDTGAVTLTQDPKGAQQIYSYDSIGRISRQTYHDSVNNVDGTNTSYGYFPSLNQIQFSTLLDPGVMSTSTEFLDGAGRVRQTIRNFPGSTGGFSTQQFVYDVIGRLAQQSYPTETDGNGTPTGDDSSTGFVFSSQQFDWAGRSTFHFNPDGTSSVISYSGCGCAGGLVETATDEVGRSTRTTQDALGRVAKVEILNLDGSVYKTTTRTFDALDNPTNTLEQQGSGGTTQATTMTYDGFGRLLTSHRPEQKPDKSTVYSYYGDDRLQSVTDARGAVKSLIYNGRGKVTQISYTKPDGSPAAGLTITLGYDPAGNRVYMTDSVGSVSYTYDTWSRLLDETRTFNSITTRSFSLDYTYNMAGQLTSLSDPFKGVVSYFYDSAGHLTSVTGAGKGSVPTYLSSAQYRASGPPKQLSFGDNSVETYTYDPNTRISSFSITDPMGTQFMGSSIGYFGDGRVKSVQDTNRAFDHSFAYDQAGRISSAHSGINAGLGSTLTGPYDDSFGYDVWNNMLSRSETLWAGDAFDGSYSTTYTNNRNSAWTYDTEGNVLTTETTQFGYNAADQQVTSTDASRKIGTTTVSLTLGQDFDGDGLLADQSSNGSTTYYIRSSVLGGVRIAEVAADGTRSASYIYSSGGWLLARLLSGTVNWVHINPATQSEGRTQPGIAGFRANELDPLGNNAGLEDPGIPPGSDGTSADLLYPKGGDPTDLSGGCTLDGAAVPCSIVASINRDAIDIARPTALGIWSKSLGQYVGIARYDPTSGQYVGVLDGHVVSGNPGGPVAIDGRYHRNPPTLRVGTEYVDVTGVEGASLLGQQGQLPTTGVPPPRPQDTTERVEGWDAHEAEGGDRDDDWLLGWLKNLVGGGKAKAANKLASKGLIGDKSTGKEFTDSNKYKFRRFNYQPVWPGPSVSSFLPCYTGYGCWELNDGYTNSEDSDHLVFPDWPNKKYILNR